MKDMNCWMPLVLGLSAWSLSNTAVGQSFGLTNRVANTAVRLPLSPPVYGYTTTNAFGNLACTNPVVIASPPGETNRLFVAEQGGRVSVITNLIAPPRTIFPDLGGRIAVGNPTDERDLLGLAFHPGYATNGYFYVFYSFSTTTPAGTGLPQRVSRFAASPSNPDIALADPEQALLTMRDEANNHTGGAPRGP